MLGTLVSRKSALVPLLALAVGFFIFGGATARAQTANAPQFLLTWQATGSYVPPGYQGKALPNLISTINASMELIQNGKPVDLSDQTIYWYQNDILIGGGTGTRHISFTSFGGAPNFITLKVELPSYNGGLLLHEIQIPIVQPKAVIGAQHPSGQFSGNPLTLQATPYFFNVTDPSSLSYIWSVDGVTATAAENPNVLQVNLGANTAPGTVFAVNLTITNSTDETTANDATNLTYVPSL